MSLLSWEADSGPGSGLIVQKWGELNASVNAEGPPSGARGLAQRTQTRL